MQASDVPSEVESKLRVPEERILRAIARLRSLGQYRLQPRPTQRLHTVYVDTDNLDLARRGVGLRLRRHHGGWEVTAKWGGDVDGSVHRRPELNIELTKAPDFPFFLPEGPLSLYLGAVVLGRPLKPILICDTVRRVLDVMHPDAASSAQPVAEIALDRVRYRDPRSTAGEPFDTYCEVEIEQREGSTKAIEQLTDHLRSRFELPASASSKLAHGMHRLYEEKALLLESPPALTGRETTPVALRRIISVQLERLRENDPGTRLGREREALHNMRVAVRRMRAALRVFEGGAGARVRSHLRRELRWLGQVLGEVRDLDVQLQQLERHGSTLPAVYRSGLKAFRRHLEDLRADRRADLLAALDSPRYVRLLLRLEEFAASKPAGRRHTAPEEEPLGRYGATLVKKAFKHLRAAGRKAASAAAPERLHPLRLRAKRARYLLEFLADIIGKPGRRLAKRLTRVQNLLGAINDSVVATDLVCRYLDESPGKASASTHLALQEVARAGLRHSDASRKDFRKAWRRLDSKRGLADLQEVIKRLKKSANNGTL